MIVADNGSSWYISGQPSTRWNDDILSQLGSILGSNFEAVDLRPIVSSLAQPSGSTAGGTAVTVQGLNFSGNAGKLKVFFGTTEAASVTIVSDTTLIATSPAHAAGTVDVTVNSPYGTSALTTADRFTFGAGSTAAVAGRHIFYNQSAWDGDSVAISFLSDAAAIAPDKSAYLPGGGDATVANFTNYSRGINGIIVDLTSGGSHAAISAGDFVFRISDTSGANANSPQSWAAAPAPLSVQVSIGGGAGGSDRVEIVWASGAIANRWLEVQVKANASTGLASTFGTINGNAIGDVFFFGSRVGDGNSSFSTTNADAGLALNNPGAATLTNPLDYDRSRSVTNGDAGRARAILARLPGSTLLPPAPSPPLAVAAETVTPASPRPWQPAPASPCLSAPAGRRKLPNRPLTYRATTRSRRTITVSRPRSPLRRTTTRRFSTPPSCPTTCSTICWPTWVRRRSRVKLAGLPRSRGRRVPMCDTLAIVSSDGVLFAKNSDREPNEGQFLDWQPRQSHAQGQRLRCTWIEIPQVAETYAVLLSRPFWIWGAEIGTNEFGVTIGNEAVFTREPYAKSGLLGMDLLRLALERLRTAADAVQTIVKLLGEHGQGGGCKLESPGFTYHNSYIVADPRTAFVLETAGRHHAVEEIRGARSISNGLTIPGFAERHSDFLKTRVSACRLRRARTQDLAERAAGPAL